LIIAGGRVAYQHDTQKLTFDELQRAYQEVV
jgi:hypothetical protein